MRETGHRELVQATVHRAGRVRGRNAPRASSSQTESAPIRPSPTPPLPARASVPIGPGSSTTSSSSAEEETSQGGAGGRCLRCWSPGPFGREDPLSGACFFPQGRGLRAAGAPRAGPRARGRRRAAAPPNARGPTRVSVHRGLGRGAGLRARASALAVHRRAHLRAPSPLSSRASVLMDVPDGALVRRQHHRERRERRPAEAQSGDEPRQALAVPRRAPTRALHRGRYDPTGRRAEPRRACGSGRRARISGETEPGRGGGGTTACAGAGVAFIWRGGESVVSGSGCVRIGVASRGVVTSLLRIKTIVTCKKI